MKSKTTAAILALFLGSFGVHRFYLNQSGLGLLYLLFCWTGIPFLISLIDFIGFLLMDENTFNYKYNYYHNRINSNNNINTITNNVNLQNVPTASSSSDEIKKLFELKEKGILTQEEFEHKKKQLL